MNTLLTPNFSEYFEHAMSIRPEEEELREDLLPRLPDTIIDGHTHCSSHEFIDGYNMPERIYGHMMSTFPDVDIEQSAEIDMMFFPGKKINKLRFAHIYPGLDHKSINKHILSHNNNGDRTALFGLSNSIDDIEYTIEELRTGKYSALKMYYMSSEPPMEKIFEYFPREVLDVAQKEEVPIILHLPHSLYNSREEVRKLAEIYPDLKIVLAHVGVANAPKPELDSILSSFAEHPNIYVDTALVDSADVVFSALKKLGRKRVIYGSDEPLNLMRTVTYFNPDLQMDRVLTDYPYHWANQEEQSKWKHLANKPFVHNQWHQLGAIAVAVQNFVSGPEAYESVMEDVFANNARKVFGFD